MDDRKIGCLPLRNTGLLHPSPELHKSRLRSLRPPANTEDGNIGSRHETRLVRSDTFHRRQRSLADSLTRDESMIRRRDDRRYAPQCTLVSALPSKRTILLETFLGFAKRIGRQFVSIRYANKGIANLFKSALGEDCDTQTITCRL